MSLENILNEIDRSREEQIKKINDYYDQKINEIKATCNTKIKHLEEDFAIKGKNDTRSIIGQYEDRIKIQTKQIIDSRKRDIIKNALEESRSHITSLNKSSKYRELLQNMIDTAITKFGNDLIIHCSENDEEKIKSILTSANIIVDKNIKSGLIAVTKDGKKMIDFRLNSIFDSISDELSLYFYENIK